VPGVAPLELPLTVPLLDPLLLELDDDDDGVPPGTHDVVDVSEVFPNVSVVVMEKPPPEAAIQLAPITAPASSSTTTVPSQRKITVVPELSNAQPPVVGVSVTTKLWVWGVVGFVPPFDGAPPLDEPPLLAPMVITSLLRHVYVVQARHAPGGGSSPGAGW
jgi:hypothetical protein